MAPLLKFINSIYRRDDTADEEISNGERQNEVVLWSSQVLLEDYSEDYEEIADDGGENDNAQRHANNHLCIIEKSDRTSQYGSVTASGTVRACRASCAPAAARNVPV